MAQEEIIGPNKIKRGKCTVLDSSIAASIRKSLIIPDKLLKDKNVNLSPYRKAELHQACNRNKLEHKRSHLIICRTFCDSSETKYADCTSNVYNEAAFFARHAWRIGL